MQAIEHVGKKSILVDVETHQRLSRLRVGGQTFGDVVAESVAALEMERERGNIPCIDDITEEELDRREKEMLEHPEKCYSLEDILKRRAEKNGIEYV